MFSSKISIIFLKPYFVCKQKISNLPIFAEIGKICAETRLCLIPTNFRCMNFFRCVKNTKSFSQTFHLNCPASVSLPNRFSVQEFTVPVETDS